jgi:hypothetical protein
MCLIHINSENYESKKYIYLYMSAYICREIQNNKRVSLFF